jgi:hypothetical protein
VLDDFMGAPKRLFRACRNAASLKPRKKINWLQTQDLLLGLFTQALSDLAERPVTPVA